MNELANLHKEIQNLKSMQHDQSFNYNSKTTQSHSRCQSTAYPNARSPADETVLKENVSLKNQLASQSNLIAEQAEEISRLKK
jgi:hypothetical protein